MCLGLIRLLSTPGFEVFLSVFLKRFFLYFRSQYRDKLNVSSEKRWRGMDPEGSTWDGTGNSSLMLESMRELRFFSGRLEGDKIKQLPIK